MTNWTLGDLLWIVLLVMVGYFIVKSDIDSDKRADYIKYVEDPRNGCVLQQTIPLANHQVHVVKSEYKSKILRVYQCVNGLTAANISKE